MHLGKLCLIYLLVAFFGCSRKSEVAAAPPKGEVQPHGIPTAPAVVKTIGPAGGTLATTDGRLSMTIPAGAVSQETAFSIEPLTNTLPGSPGSAYRLKPEGVAFSKPVTLTLTYNDNDLDSTAAQALFMAYQSTDGIWRFLPNTGLDETARTLTVQTTHFSDWAPFAMFWLHRTPAVQVGKSGYLAISTTENFTASWQPGTTPLEIAKKKVLNNPDNVRNWELIGAGGLQTEGTTAVYTAPARVPSPNPVTVTVEIHNFIPAGVIPGRGQTGKVILFAKIRVVEDTYHYGTIGGAEFTTIQHWYFYYNDILNVQGIINNDKSVSVNIYIGPLREGTYRWSPDGHQGDAVLGYLAQGQHYFMYYRDCQGKEVTSPGNVLVTIKKEGDITYLEGEYQGTVYKAPTGPGPCGPGPSLLIRGHYRVRAR